MPDSFDGAWRRRGAEGLTIVVSILLALAAEAAWGYRGDRAAEREILAGLRVEFAQAESEIRSDLRAREEILGWTRRLLAVRAGSAPEPPPDSLAEMLSRTLGYRFYTPAHPVLEDLLASGRLELIRSDTLRGQIMRYMQERDRIGVSEERERDLAANRIEPFLETRVDLAYLALQPSDTARSARQARRFYAAIREPAFGSLLYYRIVRTEGAAGFGEILLGVIQDVRRSLD
ncbi:MAG TPA: hypothetical protein VLA33_05555 [Gemmatimonadota bacterium]|nr:hypothetical protein [Gemmatimonadota bacterium]